MILLEFRLRGTSRQYQAIDEAIRTTQFIRNKCVRLWQDTWGTTASDLSAYCRVLAQEYAFVRQMNSMARQAAAERAWAAISRFYRNCKNKKKRPWRFLPNTPRRNALAAAPWSRRHSQSAHICAQSVD